MSEAKQELIRLIRKQPADSTAAEVVDELVFHLMVLRGLEDVRAGRLVSHEEVGRHIQELGRQVANPNSMEVTQMSEAKQEVLQLIEELPEESSLEDIVREMAFYLMVKQGLEDVDNGRVMTREEAARRMKLWVK